MIRREDCFFKNDPFLTNDVIKLLCLDVPAFNQYFKTFKSREDVMKIHISVILFLTLTITTVNTVLAQDLFYYSRGEKVPLTLADSEITVKFNASASPSFFQVIKAAEPTLGLFSPLHPAVCKGFQSIKLEGRPDVKQLVARLKSNESITVVNPVYMIKGKMRAKVYDRFVVQFLPSVPQAEVDALNALHHVEGVSVSKASPNLYTLRVTKLSDLSVLDMANLYHEYPGVEYSLPDFLTEVRPSSVPNDTYFQNQYYLHNTGVSGADINILPAWDITEGSASITVAVIDEGGMAHEDLPSSRIVSGYDFVDNDDDPSPGGNQAHGMAAAGIIAASRNNSMGIAGVAPNCKIMFLRVFNHKGEPTTNAQFAAAIDFAWQSGADVLSNSWGFPDIPDYWDENIAGAIDRALHHGRGSSSPGSIVVVSAGNTADRDGYDGFVEFPATVPGVIAVGATDRFNDIQYYSPQGSLLSVVAPSGDLKDGSNKLWGDVWSLDIPNQPGWNSGDYGIGSPTYNNHYVWDSPGGDSYPPGDYTAHFGGTSAACPQAAGIAALMLSVNSELREDQVKTIIQQTANDMGPGGFDIDFGYGRVNAYQAVLLSLAYANKSVNGDATAYNNNHVIEKDASGRLHTVFQSGGEIFYTGTAWDFARRISNGSGASDAPSIAVANDGSLQIVWQQKVDNYNYHLWYSRSSDIGSTWSVPFNLADVVVSYNQSNAGSGQGPTPVIAAMNGSYTKLLCVWAQSDGLKYKAGLNTSEWLENLMTVPSTLNMENVWHPSLATYGTSSDPPI